jgi:hypothetical protein
MSEVKVKIHSSIGTAYTVLLYVPDAVIQGGDDTFESYISEWISDHTQNVEYWEIDND